MSAYQLTATATIIRTADMASIPNDPSNKDYAEYLAWAGAGGVPDPYAPQSRPPVILSQDLMAQFTADDAAKIQAAIAGNAQFWLLWNALTTQKDPMTVTNARFLRGWNALVSVLGQPRMNAIATALGVPSLVV
jgi:hypothetical protein